jgi:hypothetical protein
LNYFTQALVTAQGYNFGVTESVSLSKHARDVYPFAWVLSRHRLKVRYESVLAVCDVRVVSNIVPPS